MDQSIRHSSNIPIQAVPELPHQAQIALQQVDNLKYFLISAPVDWAPDQYIRRFLLPTGDYVSCVLWNNLFHISGTDIVRCLQFRFHAFGRPVKNVKKFEEGIFSDLRNLKAGNDASLEEPKSPFLDFLYKNNCIRTQKKQKVFFWYSVPHDRLFLDALERDLKRELAGQETTSAAEAEPALSFEYDASQSLFDQLNKSSQRNSSGIDDNGEGQSPGAGNLTAPKNMVSTSMPHVHRHLLNDQMTYSQSTIPTQADPTMGSTNPMMTDQTNNVSFALGPVPQHHHHHQQQQHTNVAYDWNGIPHEHMPQRHASLPAFVAEASPAPSFVSNQSFYEDYSRGVSYEPITPPQPTGYQSYSSDVNYAPPEDPVYFASKLDNSTQFTANSYNQVRHSTPTSVHHHHHHRYGSLPRQMPASNLYQQAKPAYGLSYSSPYSAGRPSNLQRSVSASVVSMDPQTQRAMSGPPSSFAYIDSLRQTPDVSCHCSPVPTADGQLSIHTSKRSYSSLMNDESPINGYIPTKRARSVSRTESTQSPDKTSHQCPIPGCSRFFKRLEHLKRHVRTHTNDRPYQCEHCGKTFSRSDNLSQHKRIHEFNADASSFVQDDLIDSGSFVEDSSQLYDFSPDAQTHAGSAEDFLRQSSFGNTSDAMSAANSSFYIVPGSMGPPPLSARASLHVQGM